MQFIFKAVLTLSAAVAYVLLLDMYVDSPRVIQKVIVLPAILILFLLYRFSLPSWKKFINHQGKWLFIFLGAVFIELIVIATNGFSSPFLILIHLFMIALSFLFGFSLSLIFLLTAFLTIIADMVIKHTLTTFFLTNPSTFVLQIISLITIAPVAYIVAKNYSIKDLMNKKMHMQVVRDEKIFENVTDLIIITDPELNIISVNDAVERALLLSKSQLLQTPIFTSILLKDAKGKLVTNGTFFPKKVIEQPVYDENEEFTLVKSAQKQPTVNIHIQLVKDLDARISQVTFVLSYVNSPAVEDSQIAVVEKARANYEALLVNLRKFLQKNDKPDVYHQLLMLGRIDSDIYSLLTMQEHNTLSKVDLADLTRRIVDLKKDYAAIFSLPVTFELLNFGKKDIKPLLANRNDVSPEKLTGPFFTVENDIQKIEILIKKLVDVSILLASTGQKHAVGVSIQRKHEEILLQFSGECSKIENGQTMEIFKPYYGTLATKTNLLLGSGLEGYLIKKISDSLKRPVHLKINNKGVPSFTFSFSVKRYKPM